MSIIGLNRNTIDKYYTKDNIVDLCINLIKNYLIINKEDLCIEPSAGNGAFILKLKELFDNYIFYDLEPEHDEIIKQDFLLLNYKDIINKYNNIHIIGNPPFGRQSSLALKFIKKSCEFCNSFSFILPKSFKKDSLKNKINIKFHLIYEIDLPNKAFLVNNIEHDVPCVFQIWEKKNYNRIINKHVEPNNFLFVNKQSSPDFSFRRVGVNAGKIDLIIDKQSIQSHYFIKLLNNNKEEQINKLLEIKYEFNNTVGPKSISKQELINKFNQIL